MADPISVEAGLREQMAYRFGALAHRAGWREGHAIAFPVALEAALALAMETVNANTSDTVRVPREPTEAQWGGLARSIMMWLDMEPKTPRALFQHLKQTGEPVPQWLRDEEEMKFHDHVPSKGTRCVLIYRAMVEDAASTIPDVGEGS